VPALKKLEKMNLTKYLSLNCDSAYKISSMACSGGKLQVTVDYTEDLEAQQCNFSLAYDPTIAKRPASKL